MDDDDDDIGWCSCGAAWFELAAYEDAEADTDIGAVVCITTEGGITGYAGKLVCAECGADWTPTVNQRPLLTVIAGGKT